MIGHIFLAATTGQYIPETLVATHNDLAKAYEEAKADPSFMEEYQKLREGYIGGPTPMYYAERLTKDIEAEIGRPCAQIWLKREELAHTVRHDAVLPRDSLFSSAMILSHSRANMGISK